MTEETDIRKTLTPMFGYGVKRSDADGTNRTMELVELHDQAGQLSYGVVMITHWPGQEKPVRTQITLSVDGLAMLTELLSNVHNLRDYPLSGDEQKALEVCHGE